MKVAIVLPVPLAKKYSEYSDYHLCLAHLVMPYPEYADLYKSKSRNGEFVILDNSMMERGEPMHADYLLHIAERVGATEVVAPDYQGNAQKTVWEVAAFVQRSGTPPMMAPQGSNPVDWMWAAGFMTGLLFKMKGSLGIPKSVDSVFGTRESLVKALFARFALPTQVHLLGVNRNPIEIVEYGGIKIRGIDMKFPVWAGLRGLRIDEGAGLLRPKDDPRLDLESDEDSPLIAENIRTVLKWAEAHTKSCTGH